ncbi:MAG: hypothetical protein CVV27_14220 [Candidatus Melainabacteria bacterium HGW-Melainabacteria-1]|nr:MAG: hypothetical protein CVV27_14220 [Candidatus Melainabacteria bacterium HGW-Melainabacteria-1]
MGDMRVKQAQPAQDIEKDLKSAGRGALDNIRTVRNLAAGVAVAGATAMAAEALGVVTIPAMIPTGLVTLAAGGVAAATGIIVAVGDGVDKLISDADKQREQALPQ